MLHRREFFTHILKGKTKGFLPLAPFNVERSLFNAFCTQCKEYSCIKACDEVFKQENTSGILAFLNDVVQVDFSISGCKLCGECAKVCHSNVLSEALFLEQNPNWNFSVKIDATQCLAHQKTMCYTCKDICRSILGQENAIHFVGLFYPEILQHCIGCGECVHLCPTQAIYLDEIELIQA